MREIFALNLNAKESNVLRKLAKDLIPKKLHVYLGRRYRIHATRREYWLDSSRYLRNSAPNDALADNSLRGRQLECQVTKDYHRIEKGLALADPKQPFGADVAKRLALLVPISASTQPSENFVGYAVDAQKALEDWNDFHRRDDIVSPRPSSWTHESLRADEMEWFFKSRKSVRDFDIDRSIPRELLEKATELAGQTPSVCNRQSWKARFFEGSNRVLEVLSFQNGNLGFRDSVPCVAVITVDTRLFAGSEERNQPWIEGGLFAMSLTLALHGLGLATCLLNMSVNNAQSVKLRQFISANDAEVIIMMLAIGYPSHEHRVARSPRRPLHEIAEFIS